MFLLIIIVIISTIIITITIVVIIIIKLWLLQFLLVIPQQLKPEQSNLLVGSFFTT